MERNHLRKLIFAALCIALGVVLPMLMHSIPKAGMIWLPMHIPVLLAGFLAGPFFGLIVGVLTPLISSVTTGMPPAGPVLFSMMIELAVYGLIAGLVFKYIKTKSEVINVYISLILAMLCGRVVMGLVQNFFFSAGNYSLNVWLGSAFVTALPGILLQLVVVPMLYFIVKKAGLTLSRDK